MADIMLQGENVTKGVKTIAKIVQKNSITRLAKDSVFQFPFMISEAIDTDEKFELIKAAEKNYASLVVSVFSLYGDVDIRKHKSIAKYLKGFHDNNAKLFNILESAGPEMTLDVSGKTLAKGVGVCTESFVPFMWDDVENLVVTESLNDMYKPYASVYNRLESAFESYKIAKEASDTIYNTDTVPRDKDGKAINAMKVLVEKYPKDHAKAGQPIMYDKFGKEMDNGRGKPRPVLDRNGKIQYEIEDTNKFAKIHKTDASMKRARNLSVVRAEKTDSLSPTFVNITFVVHDAATKWMQDIVIGVKAMVRNVKSSVMVANMIEAAQDQPIFTFLAWTSGEKKISDWLFDLTKLKKDISVSNQDKWLTALRKRAQKRSLYQAVLKRNVNPNSTIIITEQEAMDIKERSGVDIYDARNIRRIMDKYFLLGFGIYSTESKVLDIMYDGDADLTSFSLRTLIAENKKETSLLAMNKY